MSRTKRRHAKKGTPAGEVLDHITGNDPEHKAAIHNQKLNVLVAEMIHEARTDAGPSQAQLTELVDATQGVVSRLEDADDDGHSLSMLQRIAEALHLRLEVRMVPVPA